MCGPRRSCAVLLAFAVVVSLAPLASAAPAERRAIHQAAAASVFGTPQAGISGSVAERFGPVLVSFQHDSGGADSWSEADTVSESDASAQADQVYAMTSGVGGLERVEATGSATATRGIEVRVVDASSGYSVTFELQEPTPFSVTGTVSASSQSSAGVLGVAGASLSPGIFNVSVKAETSGQVTKPVNMTGVLPPDDYTLSLSAGASGGTGARPPPNTAATVEFDIEFTLNPPSATAPIVVAGGPEPSNLELKVDSLSPGFRYTFTDSAPLQINDTRCQPPASGAIVCESPIEVPLSLDFGAGDDIMTLTGTHPFAQLTVDGGPGNDTLVASPIARGGEDDDTITAGNCPAAGECLLEGGPGDDVLTGGPGNDRLRGGTDSDQLVGNLGRDSADYSDFSMTVIAELELTSTEPEPEQGSDTIAADIEDLVGGAGDDELTGGAIDNRIEGLGGGDTLAGDDGNDRLIGGEGDDDFAVLGGDGLDQFVGGAGRDTVDYDGVTVDVTATIGGQGTIAGDPNADSIGSDIEAIHGGEGFDTLTGSAAGDEELLGRSGNDELVGEGGADVLDGGADNDLVTYSGSQPVVVTLADEAANDGHAGEGDKLLRVEDVTGGDGDDVLIGNADSNALEGEGGSDQLAGLAGTNFLTGGPGDDVLVDDDEGQDIMSGEEGTDTADYSADTLGVVVDPEPGPTVPCNDGAQGHDCVLDDVENIDGGSGDDALDGTAAANVLRGNGGADELNGFAGEDILVGGDGGDELLGGAGNDDLRGLDELDILDGEAGDDILDAGPGGGPLRGGEGNDELLGGEGDDDLFGGEGNDELVAGAGEDGLLGEAGNDVLDGGLGPDRPIDGGDDEDTLLYADRTRAVLVDPEGSGAAAPSDDGESGEGDQVLDTVENVTGGSGDDTLTGTADANTLVGNDGKDVINGLGGPDVLEGGRDADTLLSQDGVRDEDFCGPSFDSVAADLIDNVSVDCEVVTFPVSPPPPPAPPGVNTPPGTSVVVQPAGAPVTVTFSSVTTPGQTNAVTSSTGPAVPSGFQAGSPPRFYEISTTAIFTPPVTVCLNTTGVTFPGGVPGLFHFELGAWRDVTTSVGPGPQVCGVVSSLSPFAAFSPRRAIKVVRCVVPNVRGKTLAAARKAIRRANCSVGRVRRAHSAKARTGRVVSQAPRPGTRLRKGARVTLVLSSGRRK